MPQIHWNDQIQLSEMQERESSISICVDVVLMNILVGESIGLILYYAYMY